MINETNKLDVLNKKLSNVTEVIYAVESEKRKLEQKNDEINAIFIQSNQLYSEMQDTWREGKMNAILNDMDMELRHHKTQLFEAFSEENESLLEEKWQLEDERQEIDDERKKENFNEGESAYGR